MEGMVKQEFWKGKNVLITGHTGFKGSWLCMLLKSLGANISGFALNPPTNPNLYNLCKINTFVNTTIGDIRDLNSVKEKIERVQPDIIIHMAAQPLVRLSYHDPVTTFQTNVMGTVNLFEAVRISSVKSVKVIVNVTTDKCYENKEWLWPYRENEPLGGYDPYSSSKACSEIVTSAYRNSFFNPLQQEFHQVAIGTARAGNVIGGGDWANDRLIPDIINSILEDKTIIIRSPDAIRPWQHVLEPLNGYLVLAQELYNNPNKTIGAWNFGPTENDAKSVRWIVEQFCKKWKTSISFEIDRNPQPHEATYLKLDSSKARNLLGWTPVWNLEQTLDSIIDFALAFQKREDLIPLCEYQIKKYLQEV